jgi:hypothetical protein
MALVSLVGLLSTGPAPGDTGGCGETAEPASALQFCIERDRALLTRRLFPGSARPMITRQEWAACTADVPEDCQITTTDNWPPSCLPAPTVRETRDCVEALMLAENVGVPLEAIDACQVCPTIRSEPECGGN